MNRILLALLTSAYLTPLGAQIGLPVHERDKYFYTVNSGTQSFGIVYVQNGITGKSRVLIDPTALSADGRMTLSYIKPSPGGRYVAYGVLAAGAEWQEIRLRDVGNGKDLADNLKWVKEPAVSWTRDGLGFVYSRYDVTSGTPRSQLYYHRVGTPQSEDELIYEEKNQPGWKFNGEVTHDGQFLIINITQGDNPGNRLYFIDLANPKKPNFYAPVVRLIDNNDAVYDFIGNWGNYFYVRTTYKAPRGMVVVFDNNVINKPDKWVLMVPESADTLVSAQIVGDNLITNYLHDGYSVVRFYVQWSKNERKKQIEKERKERADSIKKEKEAEKSGKGRVEVGEDAGDADKPRDRGFPRENRVPPLKLRAELKLPGQGIVSNINGNWDDDEMFYTFSSSEQGATVYRHDFKTGKTEVFNPLPNK